MVLFHAGTGLLRELLTSPLRTHDMSQAVQLHPALQPGDIGLGDRGFCSYAHLALLGLKGVFGVFRIHQKIEEVTLVTTLLDADLYPLLALAELYRQRWQAEQHLQELKTILHMDVLRCKTVDGVLKELHVFALVYNLTRVVLCAAARRQELPIARLSFIDAVRWLRSAKAGEVLSKLVVNPDRPDRVEPRVVKRRPKEYDRMTQPGPSGRGYLRGRLRRKGGDTAPTT